MKYIITGGGFDNKGAESMLYTVISEIRAKEPNSDITLLLSEEFDKSIIDKMDNIKIINVNYLTRLKSLKFMALFKAKLKKQDDIVELLNEFKTCDAVIDISGYILSSQWDWADCDFFLCTIRLAKKYNKKVIILPQSFGPLEFGKKQIKYIKKYLSKAYIIFCREKDGFNHLKNIGLSNIVLSPDIVLQNSKPYKGIFKKDIEPVDIKIKEKSILIVPSRQIAKRADEKDFLNMYKNIINYLLNLGYNIYLSYYENGDREVCKKIKQEFSNNEKVDFIDKELNCIQFSQILNSFDFLITSRFHSCVHSYKKYVPCLIIGWAIKYDELAELLEQKEFVFDCRDGINEKLFKEKLDYMIKSLPEQKERIKQNVLNIQKNNCFDKMWDILKYGK